MLTTSAWTVSRPSGLSSIGELGVTTRRFGWSSARRGTGGWSVSAVRISLFVSSRSGMRSSGSTTTRSVWTPTPKPNASVLSTPSTGASWFSSTVTVVRAKRAPST